MNICFSCVFYIRMLPHKRSRGSILYAGYTMKKMYQHALIGCISVFLSGAGGRICAQSKLDSLQQLPEVTVVAHPYKEVIPAQRLTGKELHALNSFSVADAIRYFSGVQIKDYGGIGGLKTVNVRSMGTHHVGIFYDGIQLGNAQNGQIDLGKFSLDNMEEISLYNGQKSEILQPAKDFASSASVYLRSRTPKFEKDKRYNLRAVFKIGSFGLVNPSVLYEHRFNDRLSASINGEFIHATGRYKFRYKRVYPRTSKVMYDTTAVRQNGDVSSQRLEAGLYGVLPQGHWKWKNYFYNSERGIPGAIVNNRWKNPQRQWDRSFFSQGSLRKAFGKKYELLANAKYAYDYMRFQNPDTTLMLIDNTFRQQEFYLSAAHKYALAKKWEVSLSTDVQYNTLTSDMDGFVFPKRLTAQAAVASAAEIGWMKMQGSLLGTFVRERVNSGNLAIDEQARSAPDKKELSPALFISYKPFRRHEFNLRAFYKHIFRMPTFNDLYYTDIGNADLKPEFTHQYNIGAHYVLRRGHGFLRHWQIQADAYYNHVTNKIVAVPKGSGQYRWMMMNLGEVEIRGIETSSSFTFNLPYRILGNLKMNYTYQRAQDFTKRKSSVLQATTYGGQIAYIPRHDGSVIASLNYRSWQLNYSFIYVGERYHSSANIPEEYEQPWYTHDMGISKTFVWRATQWRLNLEVNNLLSQDYEVVLNYPMPKRNYKLSLTVTL